jgi:glycosyltransferase involved in cell wall biosynthesis
MPASVVGGVKIVFAGASGDNYGADAVLRAIAVHMQSRGAECLLVLPGDGPGRLLAEKEGLRVEILPMPVLRKADLNLRGLARLGAALGPSAVSHVRLLHREQPDVVWANTVTIPLWIAAARLLRRTTVCHTHEIVGGSAALRRLMYAPLLLADQVLTVSEACRADIGRTWHTLGKRTSVLFNPSFGVREPIPIRDGSERHVVVIGRISPRKGHAVLFDALAEPGLAALRPVVHVCGTAYGSPATARFTTAIRRKAAALRATVHFHGYVPTLEALSLGGIVVVPSVEPEACPLVIPEAMAAGRAVIATDCGGIAEIAGGAAVLVEPARADILSAALAHVLTDDQEREALQRAGLARIQRLSVDRYFADIRRLLAAAGVDGGCRADLQSAATDAASASSVLVESGRCR